MVPFDEVSAESLAVGGGEEIEAEGRTWILGHVEIDESIRPAMGVVSVIQPQEPTPLPPPSVAPPS